MYNALNSSGSTKQICCLQFRYVFHKRIYRITFLKKTFSLTLIILFVNNIGLDFLIKQFQETRTRN